MRTTTSSSSNHLNLLELNNNTTTHNHVQPSETTSADFLLKPNPFNLPITTDSSIRSDHQTTISIQDHNKMNQSSSSSKTNYRVSAFGVSDHQSSHLIHPGMINGKPGGGDCAKLCPRHQRMANEGINSKLQAEIETLPESDQEAINTAWGLFSSSNTQRRRLILSGLLMISCPSQISFLTDSLKKVCRIDPFSRLPKEISLKILCYFDAFSLGKSAQVSKLWKKLSDDDLIWKKMCEQHIEKKCLKCGWSLPSMEKRKKQNQIHQEPLNQDILKEKNCKLNHIKHLIHHEEEEEDQEHQKKRICQRNEIDSIPMIASTSTSTIKPISNPINLPTNPTTINHTPTKPWKTVYTERLALERNWRKGIYHETILTGHTDSITCLQLEENFTSPSYPILMTGSWDRTIRVWNLENQESINLLKGHSRGIRCLQFDKFKLITGAMDGFLKIWNWRTGECMRSIEAHSDGVVCLKFDDEILASGSADGKIRIWNFKTGGGFVLRGHREWVNSVEIWSPPNPISTSSTSNQSNSTNTTTGKLLFSASDDGLIKVWNLDRRETVRVLEGHMAQVQSIKLITIDDPLEDDEQIDLNGNGNLNQLEPIFDQESLSIGKKLVLVSGSLDNCLKVWDLENGSCMKTMFGHIQGVWNVDADKLRVVSGSHDRSLKIWDRITGKCIHTIVGHRGAVMSIGLSDDKIISGGDDGEVRIWSFAPVENLRFHQLLQHDHRVQHDHLLQHQIQHNHLDFNQEKTQDEEKIQEINEIEVTEKFEKTKEIEGTENGKGKEKEKEKEVSE